MAKVPTHSAIPTEEADQIKLCVTLERMGLTYFAVPNGGRRSFTEACRLKRAGVKAGVPDLFITEPVGAYSGLFIELKRLRGGVVSEAQEYWITQLRRKGYRAEVCKGYDAAVAVVQDYLAGRGS